jgi:glycosyltransferase involved in cell wall biosynthesis
METAGRLGIDDRVHWIQSVGQVEQVYCACDIVTSCSISEGFPNVIGEAMACGVPPVATDVGDSKEIIGLSGLIVQPGDSQALCVAWTRLLGMGRSQRDNMATAARARIVDRYSVEMLARNTMSIFESLRDGANRGVG